MTVSKTLEMAVSRINPITVWAIGISIPNKNATAALVTICPITATHLS